LNALSQWLAQWAGQLSRKKWPARPSQNPEVMKSPRLSEQGPLFGAPSQELLVGQLAQNEAWSKEAWSREACSKEASLSALGQEAGSW
jgi:hypothetical protein